MSGRLADLYHSQRFQFIPGKDLEDYDGASDNVRLNAVIFNFTSVAFDRQLEPQSNMRRLSNYPEDADSRETF